eukprot:m.370263 g.370263  ORF g.370263 m.370263 type:complete len:416 (-) comp19991_c0_seq1:192-1439(-)
MAARRNIKAVFAHNASVQLGASARIEPDLYTNSGGRFYLENFAAAVDTPGEWFVHGDGLQLDYVPLSGTDPRNMTFVAPVVAGSLAMIANTSSIVVQDIEFRHADWSIAPTNTSSGNVQAASFLDSAGLTVRNASNIVLRRIRLAHVGEHGLWVDEGSSAVTLDEVAALDTGGGGLRIGRGKPLPEGATSLPPAELVHVFNSTFLWGSQVYHEGTGILLQHASNNRVEHCEVGFYSHIGISVGWTWDYSPTQAFNNTVTRCHVHHVGNGDLSDLGGLYFLGISPGSSAAYNLVHDAYPFFTYGHGIYLDQATSNVDVHHNVVFFTEASGFHQHFGRNNSVYNNVFAYSTGGYGELMHANFQVPQKRLRGGKSRVDVQVLFLFFCAQVCHVGCDGREPALLPVHVSTKHVCSCLPL